MKPKLLAGAAIAAAALTAAGCGSSSSSSSSNTGLSYSAFSQSAGSICKEANAALKDLSTLHPATLTAAVTPLQRAQGVFDSVRGKLQALQGPSALTAARDVYTADLQQAESDIKSMISAAQSNSVSAFRTAALDYQTLKPKAKTDGSKLGAPACIS